MGDYYWEGSESPYLELWPVCVAWARREGARREGLTNNEQARKQKPFLLEEVFLSQSKANPQAGNPKWLLGQNREHLASDGASGLTWAMEIGA